MLQVSELRRQLAELGVEALWVSGPANVQAVSGFTTGRDAKVLITPHQATLYTDARYTQEAEVQSRLPFHIARPPQTYQHAAGVLQGLRVGIEAAHLSVAALEVLQREWPTSTLVPLGRLIDDLRLIKAPEEVECIRRAQALADQVWTEVRPLIKAGVRELEIALELDHRLRRRGSHLSFEPIVASGPRGALPHGHASERVIQDGELVTVDFGAHYQGYLSDMTRTVAVGEPGPELRRMYQAVLEAEEAALDAVKPGMSAAELYLVARRVLDQHGLGEAFLHSLGHGIGLEVHEAPTLRETNQDLLRPGMILTIEPGAYVAELGGVRIEDMVLVTEQGCEVLSHSEKERL